MSETKSFTLKELAKLTDSIVIGDETIVIDNISALDKSNKTSISFLANKKYEKYLNSTKAAAIVVHKDTELKSGLTFLLSSDPYLVFAKLSSIFKTNSDDQKKIAISSNAFISDSAEISKNVCIGPNSYIGPNCKLDEGVVIKANVSIAKDTSIGKNSIIHHGAIIGSDGFGYAMSGGEYYKIEQNGFLIIGNNVEIGAGCTIDRGALGDTELHDGVKLDNQVHVAHNVIIGKNSAIAACCAIAGSTVIGKNFKMGGLSGILGHLSICENVTVAAHTLITKDIQKPGEYVGIMPAQDRKDWAKSSIFIKKRNENE